MKTFPIYLMRHGLAGQFGDVADDAQRPLTAAGHTKVTQVAQRLPALDVQLDLILTSPYQRAAQTATIVHQQYPHAHLETVNDLAPEGDLSALADRLNQLDRAQSLILVGHEPNLSQIAEQLIWGTVISRIMLKKTGIIRLDGPLTGELLGACELRWLLPAKVLLA
jgi:phosphohistidine phosphatase